MKMKDICYALGVSETMGYRLRKDGMPTHSIEAAERWRAKHLDPMRTKNYRSDGNSGKKAVNGAQLTTTGKGSPSNDPVENWICVALPEKLYDPTAIAAVAEDAGLQLDGRQVLRFTQCLFNFYMLLMDGGRQELRFKLPAMLGFRPSDERFDKVARVIDGVVDEIRHSLKTKVDVPSPGGGK